MFFYIIQVFDFSYKDDIVLGLISADIHRGTFIEGKNIENLLNQDFPLFKGFFKMKEDKEIVSALFFGMCKEKKKIENLIKVLKQSGIENKDNKIYRIILLPGEEIS